MAIIDVGTNTINLLIVNKTRSDFKILHKDRKGIGLGNGSFDNSKIIPSAFDRGIECLNTYAQTCKSFDTKRVVAFGTSALRQASNAIQFINKVKEQSNIDIRIINGEKEAELIYKGIKLLYNFNQKSLVMDIGGGSTEFILADNNGIIKKTSFEIGVSRINQMFEFSNPFNKWDVYKINNYLNDSIGHHINHFKTETLIGSSGSFKTFYELCSGKKHPMNSCVEIKLGRFLDVLDDIINSSLEERTNNPLIDPIRYEMLPISAIKTKWIINKVGIKKVLISPYSLKEGVIFSS